MASRSSSRTRKQLRAFALVWTLITLFMGACTFAAIYAAYGALNEQGMIPSINNAALPNVTSTPLRAAAVVATSTLPPTREPTKAPTNTPKPTEAETEEIEPTEPPPPTATPTPLPNQVQDFELGIQVQVSYDLQDMWMTVTADQLGLKWVKQQVRWEDIEKERDNYDWSSLDVYIPAASEHGLKVLISVVTAPEWARESGVNLSKHGPPANPEDYAEFLRKILERYPGQIHAVEIWNEMNLDREWTSIQGLKASNYVALLKAAHDAIRAVDPGIIVVSGALSPTGVDDGVGAIDDKRYMDQLIAAGLLDYADCVGAHHNGINLSPDYTWDSGYNDPSAQFRGPFDNPHRSWSFRSTLQTYANQIAGAGGTQKLCVTEFGWPSSEDLSGTPLGFEFAKDNTLEEQRDFTIKAITFMQESEFVRLAFLWNLNYGAQAGWDPNNDNVPYSIIGPGTTFRPVFDALKEWQSEQNGEEN